MWKKHVAVAGTILGLFAAQALAAPSASASHSYCYSQGTKLYLSGNKVYGYGGAYCAGGGLLGVDVKLFEKLGGSWVEQAHAYKGGVMFNDSVTVSGPGCVSHNPYVWEVVLVWNSSAGSGKEVQTGTFNCF